jgi:hypothetical protein
LYASHTDGINDHCIALLLYFRCRLQWCRRCLRSSWRVWFGAFGGCIASAMPRLPSGCNC